ncbi:unnamed protein product [Rhizophagus irregularis]|nr:unnamed protein product [Rhizophagus irregularis]
MKLNDKYICEVKNHKHYFIKDDRHLSLNNFAISLWVKEIVNKNTDLDTSPNHALFSLFSQISDHNLSRKVVPSMKVFLEVLDKEFGDGKFTCYLSVFEEQEIRISHLTTLSDSEYILMSIIVIGHRQTLRDEAKKYE